MSFLSILYFQFSAKQKSQKVDLSDEAAELNIVEPEPEVTGCAFFKKHRWTTAEIITNIAMFVYQLGWVGTPWASF